MLVGNIFGRGVVSSTAGNPWLSRLGSVRHLEVCNALLDPHVLLGLTGVTRLNLVGVVASREQGNFWDVLPSLVRLRVLHVVCVTGTSTVR